MNQDTNREDRVAHERFTRTGVRTWRDRNGLIWFGCNFTPIIQQVVCLSCGATAETAETIPCGH